MKPKDTKTIVNSLNELKESYTDLSSSVKAAHNDTSCVNNLSLSKSKPFMIAFGLKLIAIPEPTLITDVAGSCIVAAGLIQEGIRRKSLYVEDLNKFFKNSLKDLERARQKLAL